MDNISVVVDSEVLSRWKFNSFAWINNNFAIKEVLLLGKSKETSIRTTIYSFLIKELSNLSLVGKFSSIPRRAGFNKQITEGNIFWLSDLPIPNDYAGTIYFIGNREGIHYSKENYLKNSSKENYGNFSILIKRNRNVQEILSYSFTELIGYNPFKTINQHLSSLKYLLNGFYSTKTYGNVEEILNQNTEPTKTDSNYGLLHKFIEKFFNWSLYFTSWSLYEYPSILSTVTKNTLEQDSLTKLFDDPPWKFKADPFYDHKTSNLYVEHFNYFSGRGYLSKFNSESKDSFIEINMPNKIHYSYPHILRNEEGVYLVPESAQNNSIDLYRVDNGEASCVKTLVGSFAGIDPTIFHYNNRYWLFATDGNGGSYWKLHIWHSKDLLGEWTPHKLNPVKSDIRSSRGAGAIYKDGPKIIRPTQNCYPSYGSSISLNEIKKLTPEHFEEDIVGEIFPPAGEEFLGIHTIANLGNKVVVDLKTQPFLPGARILPLLRSRGGGSSSYSNIDNSLLKRWGLLLILGAALILFYIFGWQTLSFFG